VHVSEEETVPTAAAVAAAFALAGLTVAPERLAANYETHSSTLALIRRVSVRGLGETAPAFGFTASWV
jgi:hypothetical protein